MISSEEFHQKLQAGQIHEALSLVMHDATELEIVTRLTEDLANSQSPGDRYLRTKINLLAGTVQNEVSENVLTDGTNYLRLQKLHTDRIVSSHRIVRDYLQQIEAILTVLPPPPSGGAEDSSDSDNNLQTLPAGSSPQADRFPMDKLAVEDDDIDLSLDRDGEVWEEWVEDEDFMSDLGLPQPSTSLGTISDRQENANWVRRQLNPLEVKPTPPRSTSVPADTATRWDKFAPEYIGSGTDPQPRIDLNNDAEQMDKLLADLDI
jgi:hypothetical protein